MKLIPALRDHLRANPRPQFRNEKVCTCGDANHARIEVFRVDGRTVAAIIPEAAQLTPQQLQRITGFKRVDHVEESELDLACASLEFACASPFEEAVGNDVYLDEKLAAMKDIVFCPQVNWGAPAGCFRIRTATLRKRLHCIVLPLVKQLEAPSEDWEA